MRIAWLIAVVLLGIIPLHETAVIKVSDTVVSGKVKLKCIFTLVYTPLVVDVRKSKIVCKPKKSVKIINHSIESGQCVFTLSMTVIKGRGKLTIAKIKCPPPTTTKTTTTHTTPTTTTTTTKTTTFTMTTTATTTPGETPVLISYCGPKECGIWCRDGETCQERENVNCVKEPCCPRWHCQGLITTPAPFPPTPTVSPTSSCCKERMYKVSTYVLVAEEETLPSCGNDCIYRKGDEGDHGQLYCFPTSVSLRENQCDFKSTIPQILVGFSPWSEWTGCLGDCGGVGRSTRDRTCVSDITDELSCNGPTKQVKNCEIYCENIPIQKQSQNCDPSTFPRNVKVQDYPCTYNFMPAMDWNGAQGVCSNEFGGKLWEPANEAEYEAVVNAAEDQANSALGTCRWWLGLFNWNDGSPYSVDAYLSSTVTAPPTTAPDHNEPSPRNGVISNFITVHDGNDLGTQNCVHTYSFWQYWLDDKCTREKPFICQSCPPPCSCSFNGVSYPCGSIIKRNPHCCSDMICNRYGTIVDQMIGNTRKPASGCCIWRGKMYMDGENFGPFWSRKVCCRGEILSKRWWWRPFPFPPKPSGNFLTISEGNETIVQENIFSNTTGILEIKVPTHKNYTDTVFILHQNSKTTMLKTNNTCQISDLPGYINVSAMAQELEGLERENSTVTEAKTVTAYVLKARKLRYGIKRRKELLPEIQDHCQNEPVIQTDDLSVNQTQFEKYNAGELILVKTEKKTRICQTHYNVCSKKGPRACGYGGWANPDPNAPVQGFTFHQVSDGSICVDCNIELPGPPPCNNGFCECKNIRNKIDLMDCVLDPDTEMIIEEGGDVISQKLTWQKQARSISISSPAHKDLQSMDIVMHAATNGYWHGHVKNNYMIKIGDECFVSTLPTNMFPVDIALGIQEIKKGNNITIKEDEVETQGIIVGLGSLVKVEENKLHADIKNRCSNAKIEKFKEMAITKEQSNDLKNGQVIFLEQTSSRSNCELMSAATTNNNSTSCWRWPNPDSSAEILVHHVVTSVITVTCCQNLPGNPSCCVEQYPDYCICEDIVDSQTFELCIPPLLTDIIGEDLDENGTRIIFSQRFIFNRDNGGSMRIEVEAHKDYEEATLMFNDTTTILRRGNSPCSIIDGTFSSPSALALMAAEIKNTHGENISIEDQTRQDYVLLQTDKTLNIEGILNICDDYYDASLMPISSEQFANLESGDIIFVDNPALGGQSSRSLSTCELKEACVTNNGSSCFRVPIPGWDTIYVHSVVSSPVCLQCCFSGRDANFCDCSDIADSDSFEFCIGPRPNALLVVTGVDTNSETFGSIEILIRDKEGNYVSKTEEGCYVENFPVNTSSATGALIEGVPHVCVGYKEGEPSNQCYGLTTNGSWSNAFQLGSPLSSWGSSVLFDLTSWWLVGGDPDGTSTEVYSAGPNAPNAPELPVIINQPCMVEISDEEAFMSAIPKFESASSNFAWLYNIIENRWTRLPNSLEKRSGPACGFLQTSNGSYIVLAGGYKSSTSEILNLDTNEWSVGPDIGMDVYGGSMVSVMDGQELILIGGYSSEAMSQVLRMNSSMSSWEPAGSLNKPRFNTVAMTVPIENLPANLDKLC